MAEAQPESRTSMNLRPVVRIIQRDFRPVVQCDEFRDQLSELPEEATDASPEISGQADAVRNETG